MEYQKRLHDLRIDHDLRQEDIAQILKTTSQAYGMYENGKRSLPIEYLIKLAKFYDVSSDYILGLSDKK
ncbi:MAG: helix-turn-helix transcriptional regulator [Clostridia bacterium]|nr:helix-turn-helix transcriptional regulator [Clostridia bacterium]